MEPKTGKSVLARLAAFLEAKQSVVTDQWVTAVRRNLEMPDSERLTHEQLIDYLPQLYQDLCAFLRRRDPIALEGVKHVAQFAHSQPDLQETQEITARSLINEFFSAVTTNSVKQFMDEQQNQTLTY